MYLESSACLIAHTSIFYVFHNGTALKPAYAVFVTASFLACHTCEVAAAKTSLIVAVTLQGIS